MTHLLLWGNAYAQIIRNGKGEVIALYPLMPNKMTVERDVNGQLYYSYTRGSDEAIKDKQSTVILKPSDVFACRLNRLRNVSKTKVISSAEKQGIVLEPIDWYPDAFLVRSSKYDLLNTDLVKGGVLYVQNASSYLPVLALEPKPEEIIFDACAAPAGKSSMIASLTGGDAKLWLNDGIKSRLEKIKQVQKLLGFKYEKLTCIPVQSIDKEINQQFDKILLDIQCSGEGMIDISKPFTMRFWNMRKREDRSTWRRASPPCGRRASSRRWPAGGPHTAGCAGV